MLLLAIVLFQLLFGSGLSLRMLDKIDEGSLAGDVQNWATQLENYIMQLANDGIKRDETQRLFDEAVYNDEKKDGLSMVQRVKKNLTDFFGYKQDAAERLKEKIIEMHDSFADNVNINEVSLLNRSLYIDSDLNEQLPDNMRFHPYFKQKIVPDGSTVKIPDEVPRTDQEMIRSIMFSKGLDPLFQSIFENDTSIRWQYFGSSTGAFRVFPGKEWDTNFIGFYTDYDARTRPWYIAATSHPKDVIILLDCSFSMHGEKLDIAKAVAKNVVDTLTKRDFVSVICARASHWDEVGKWHYFNTEVLSCLRDNMVPATLANRKDIIKKINGLVAGGTSEMERAIQIVFKLLKSKPRTGCQSIVILVTDGRDTDGEGVRCGPGYYTRSGFVPGPICRYDWTSMWNLTRDLQKTIEPKARIFSYLTVDDGELFPGKLACDYGGSMRKLINGENLISKMSNYFEFLSNISMNEKGLWTWPYIDALGLSLMVTYAVPAFSRTDPHKLIGVVGVDATLEEIKNFLSRYQWGSVYSFLITKEGQTIFHPSFKTTDLLEDPQYVGINKLEQDSSGFPESFNEMLTNMSLGYTGSLALQRGVFRPRVSYGGKQLPGEYFFAAVQGSDYAFALNLAQTDKVFRRAQTPTDWANSKEVRRSKMSIFNIVQYYLDPKVREKFRDQIDAIDVRYNDVAYKGLYVSYNFSSIFFASRCHCDQNSYMYSNNYTDMTIKAHLYVNGFMEDVGCDASVVKKGVYEKGIVADVVITQPIEAIWKARKFEGVEDVKWTYIGIRSGVFRTYPGHRSNRDYDPTKRGWYKTSLKSPALTVMSTPYMDAAGAGKVISISQAVFEGMVNALKTECNAKRDRGELLPGGCECHSNADCIIGVCYKSKDEKIMRCATERVEAVTSLDILYDTFHNKSMSIMESSDPKGLKSCSGSNYTCPDGSPGCHTRCYLFNSDGIVIMAPEFITASALDKSQYAGVVLGKKEGEVMRDLIYRQGFFRRSERESFQDSCSVSPASPLATLSGMATNPSQKDDLFWNKGPIPAFTSRYSCIKMKVGFQVRPEKLGPYRTGLLIGNVSGPCMSGFYYVRALPKTNLYLLVIENWKQYKERILFNFNCKIVQNVVSSGSFKTENGTCEKSEIVTTTFADQGKCPSLQKNIRVPCGYETAADLRVGIVSYFLPVFSSLLVFLSVWFF